MNTQYVYKKPDDVVEKNKFGVDMTIFKTDAPSGFNYEEVLEAHLEEFYNDICTFQWFIIDGEGTFVLNDEKYSVSKGDLIVAPPKTRIWYYGKMKMLLVTTPKFNSETEHQVRIVSKDEIDA